MTKSEIIDTETLRNYCLGFLTIKQEKKVELNCKEHASLARELQILRKALAKYSGNEKIFHRINLRKNVWEAVKKIWENV